MFGRRSDCCWTSRTRHDHKSSGRRIVAADYHRLPGISWKLESALAVKPLPLPQAARVHRFHGQTRLWTLGVSDGSRRCRTRAGALDRNCVQDRFKFCNRSGRLPRQQKPSRRGFGSSNLLKQPLRRAHVLSGILLPGRLANSRRGNPCTKHQSRSILWSMTSLLDRFFRSPTKTCCASKRITDS
jgi:hypothetical protein